MSEEGRAPRQHPPVGERLREARLARGISLRELAQRVDLSPSLISQVENGRARPSVSTLYAMAGVLEVSLDDLLFPDQPRGGGDGPPGAGASDGVLPSAAGAAPIDGLLPPSGGPLQRAGDRKQIRLASGVTWERLTAASEAGTEFLYVIYEVGGASSPEREFQRHGGHEWGFILRGHLRVTIGFDDYDLGPGDAISIDSSSPHRLATVGDEPVHAVWFVLGRHGLDRESGRHATHDHPADAAAPA